MKRITMVFKHPLPHHLEMAYINKDWVACEHGDAVAKMLELRASNIRLNEENGRLKSMLKQREDECAYMQHKLETSDHTKFKNKTIDGLLQENERISNRYLSLLNEMHRIAAMKDREAALGELSKLSEELGVY